jgi:hypothetical protein
MKNSRDFVDDLTTLYIVGNDDNTEDLIKSLDLCNQARKLIFCDKKSAFSTI